MSEVDKFKSAIVRIRDILRGPSASITGMDSMRHLCLYIMSRLMTRAKVAALGVPEKFCWEEFIELIRPFMENKKCNPNGLQHALERFYNNTGEDCLIKHFDRLFETNDFPFSIKKKETHADILEILNGVNMEEVDGQIDILGYVYEQHLKTGASSAGRDLGQFFTDRSICEYMTELCKPGFKSPGVPESVCDPTMGTGGFLTTYIKYYKKNYADTVIDWSVQQKQIHGCDIDPKVAGVARLNLFMEIGGNCATNLRTHNSLYYDLTQNGYDIILANMPFGIKGINYDECCKRIKALNIKGIKSEPLFLQLMMVSLNKKGRCAVVVPDGMLVNNSSCYNDTRKYLLDNFEVKRIIKMKGQFFMNTGIQPSIIFFENTGKPTTNVEFWETEKTEKGGISEKMIVSVPLNKIDATSSFDMRRYIEADKPANNPVGFPMVKLGDILTDHPVKKPVATKHADGGVFSLYSSSCDVFKHSVAEFSGQPYLLQGSRGTISKATHYCDMPFSASNNVFVISVTDPKNVSLKFIYYYLRLTAIADQTATTSIIPMLTKTMFREIKMPLPPLSIQQEIVAIFDRIYTPGTTELSNTLTIADKASETLEEAQQLIRRSVQMVADVKVQMMADIKVQMVAIINSVENRGFPMVKLSDVCDLLSGKGNYTQDGDSYPYYDSNGPTGTRKDFLYDGEFVITARKMSIGAVHYVSGKYWASDNTINIRVKPDSTLSIRFLYYWLLLNNKVLKDLSSGIKPGIRKSDVAEIKMPLPSLAFQTSVLTRLESLQAQLTALESLYKQSEDNARFILESYLSVPSQSKTADLVDDEIIAPPNKSKIVETPEEDEENEIVEPTVEPTVEPKKMSIKKKKSTKAE